MVRDVVDRHRGAARGGAGAIGRAGDDLDLVGVGCADLGDLGNDMAGGVELHHHAAGDVVGRDRPAGGDRLGGGDAERDRPDGGGIGPVDHHRRRRQHGQHIADRHVQRAADIVDSDRATAGEILRPGGGDRDRQDVGAGDALHDDRSGHRGQPRAADRDVDRVIDIVGRNRAGDRYLALGQSNAACQHLDVR